MKTSITPKDGIEGLKQNWQADAMAGFLVFLLALPLSLGIAKASEFPPAMGVLTAMIGGMFVTYFAGSRLTIKGPAAGLITICSGAVLEMGGGQAGWHLALGAIVVAAVIQIVFGFLRFGSLSDFFPPSAVHGMLAAIGLIIFSKQVHVLLGIDPATLKGMEPLELFEHIPYSMIHADPRVTLVGVISLIIIFGMPFLKIGFLKKIPAPMVVLLVTIPIATIMDFKHTEPAFDLVKIGNFWEMINFNADFSAIGTSVFWKYVIMFLFVNSLESLLTVKAIDGLDPWKRISNPNKDLIAVGLGNGLSGLLGGLPMISEVARSSANISFGARTRWANFFHGSFLFISMLLLIPVIEMIPNTALAAMLIAVGYRLASPNEFFKTYKIGVEQLAIFVITIIVTLSTDLLIGVGSGILAKLFLHALHGVPLRSLFKARYELIANENDYLIRVNDAAIFSNLIGYKELFHKIPPGKKVTLNFAEARLVDHSFMEALHHFQEEYQHTGGDAAVIGFDRFKSFSHHPLAARKLSPDSHLRIEIRLSPRQSELRDYAEENGFVFYPQRVRNAVKYKGFPIQHGCKLQYEENLLVRYDHGGKIEIADVTLSEGVRSSQEYKHITLINLSELGVNIPDFVLEPESLWTKLTEFHAGKDIDFSGRPEFSKSYYLRAQDEPAIRDFFDDKVINFLEKREGIHVEAHRNRLLIYKTVDILSTSELQSIIAIAESLIEVLSKPTVTQA